MGSRLVILEVATAVVLLVGAGLLGKSLYRLLRVSIGMQADHLATLGIVAPTADYGKDQQLIALGRQMVSEIGNSPGVKSVAIASDLSVTGWGDTTWFHVLGRPWHGEHLEVPERDVSANYFTTLGAKLQRGRYFTEDEDQSKPRVAIVNHSFVKEFFPGEEAMGKQFAFLTEKPVPIEIVGIVEDIKEGPLDTTNRSAMYIPFNQSPENYFNLAVRTSQDENSVLKSMVATVEKINPDIATAGGASMNDRINRSFATYLHRSSAWLVGGFAFLALLLSVVGLYGVIAYSVSQRTREIGVRISLGAQPGAIYKMILREAVWLAIVGIGAGLICAVGAAILMRKMLYGTRSWDVLTLVAVAAVLGIAALVASYAPARRAASVDPVEALRME